MELIKYDTTYVVHNAGQINFLPFRSGNSKHDGLDGVGNDNWTICGGCGRVIGVEDKPGEVGRLCDNGGGRGGDGGGGGEGEQGEGDDGQIRHLKLLHSVLHFF